MELVKYNAMCQAIAECHKTDEVAEMRNQAMAMEVYAKQALNIEAEKLAAEIRIRAERKCGQLLKGMERNQGKRSDLPTSVHDEPKSEFAQAKINANISDTQAKRWQRLADIPGIRFQIERPWAEAVYWMYSIELDPELRIDAETVRNRLKEKKIGTRPFFMGLHAQPALKHIGLDLNKVEIAVSPVWWS